MASSVTLNDALKRDSSSLGHAVCKHRHATHASKKKNNYYQKIPTKIASNGEPFQFIPNKLRHRSFAVYIFVVLIIVSKNKLHWCNTRCCLLQSYCLVSSRNTLSLLPLRDGSEQRLGGRIRWHAGPYYWHLVTSASSPARTYEVFGNMALVLIISARFPANLSSTCLTMHTQSRSLRGGLSFTTCL